MGACGNYCESHVNFESIDIKIPKRNVATLVKYGQGAIARREVNKLKMSYIKEITGKFYHFDSIFIFLQIWNTQPTL